ncbi:hypothetical protein HY041_02025 [Candidatus Roizmanbacteria bacterium]|nr:hypothetical protein [Candidatus Roizmanbacteria bacterium]
MVNNFTPIDVQKFRENNNLINTILLLIATLTTLVLVILLFILIQKKVQTPVETQPSIIITPTVKPIRPSPTLIPTIAIPTQTSTSSAQPKGCTLEAKICPDGSSVSRVGSNCEFPECQTRSATESSVVTPK